MIYLADVIDQSKEQVTVQCRVSCGVVLALAFATVGCGSQSSQTAAQIAHTPPQHRSQHRRHHRHARRTRRAVRRHRSQRRLSIPVSYCNYRTDNGCPAVSPPDTCSVHGALEDPHCTPGAVSPAVTQGTIFSTICHSGGYTSSVRPPESYTEPLKYREMAAYGFGGQSPGNFELDHLIPLEIGGAPADPRNLWPESHSGAADSYKKDTVENSLHDQVCSGQIGLAHAQRESLDWVHEYHGGSGSAPSHGGGSSSGSFGGPDSTSPGDKDCSDFSTQVQAQAFFTAHGGSPSYDFDGLDGDHDGKACESLP